MSISKEILLRSTYRKSRHPEIYRKSGRTPEGFFFEHSLRSAPTKTILVSIPVLLRNSHNFYWIELFDPVENVNYFQ